MRYRVASDESLIDEILNMEKLASIDSQSSFEQNLDIFDNKDIDDCLVKEGYSKEQAKNLKLASVLYAYERQDVCDNVLYPAIAAAAATASGFSAVNLSIVLIGRPSLALVP